MIFRLFFTLILLSHWNLATALELEVEIEGLDDALEKNVRHFLSIERERGRAELTTGRVRHLHKQAPEQIRKALQPYGFFRSTTEAELLSNDKGFVAHYRVATGEAVRFKQVAFLVEGPGRDDPVLTAGFPLVAGDALNQTAYEKAKDEVLSTAVEAGYLDARFAVHELRVDLDSYSASIDLRLESGPRYRFGAIRFHQDEFDPAFLRRYLHFEEGELFDLEQLRSLQTQLVDSEYFTQVEVRPARELAEGDRIPLDITLTPSKPNRYRMGIGYATDVGPRVSLDWQRRHIGDEGHRMLAELSLSPVYSQLKGEYLIPLQRPSLDSLAFTVGAEHYNNDTRKGDRLVLGATHSLGMDDEWRRNLSLEYARENFEIADTPGSAHYLMPKVSWSHLKSDGLGRVQHGHRIHYQLTGASQPLLSSSSFLQAHLRTKSIFSFYDAWRLHGRIELGASLAESAADLPASMRFYAGGDNSIRGYELDELGPQDGAGEVFGGRYLGVASLELERKLVGKWSAALFYDTGNAFDTGSDNTMIQGAGFGLRWQSPVGPVRVDLANALSRDGHPWRLHLVVGPEL